MDHATNLDEAAARMATGFVALMKLARNMSTVEIDEALPAITEQCVVALKPLFDEIEKLRREHPHNINVNV